MNGQTEEGGGGILALLCATFCKDSPLAEAFGANDNANNNQNTPLLSPITNGEILTEEGDDTHRLVCQMCWRFIAF